MPPGTATPQGQQAGIVAQLNASYGGQIGSPASMIGKTSNGNQNDFYILNPASPKNMSSPIYQYNTYVTSPRTPASTAAGMGALSANPSPFVQDAQSYNGQLESRQRNNDSR